MSSTAMEFFVTSSGRSPVIEFIDSLEAADATALVAAIQAFAFEFPNGVTVSIKPLVDKLWERKVRRFRVLYSVAKNTPSIAHAFAKKTPKVDLELGTDRLKKMMEE